MCNDLGRKCLHREGPELGLRPRTVCLIKDLNRLYSRVMVIDPEKVFYVMFSFFKKTFYLGKYLFCVYCAPVLCG